MKWFFSTNGAGCVALEERVENDARATREREGRERPHLVGWCLVGRHSQRVSASLRAGDNATGQPGARTSARLAGFLLIGIQKAACGRILADSMDGGRRGDGAGASGSGSGGAPPPGKGGGSGEQDAGRGGARNGSTDIVADIFGEDAGLNVVMLLMVLAYLINYATTKCIC